MTSTTASIQEQAGARTAVCPDERAPEVAWEVSPADARELSRHFFARLAALEEGTHEYQYVRNTLIEMNLSLVKYAAGRFRHRGAEEMEDIVQVGTIGLIKAIDRFELTREVEFASFAVPYIVGEIKRFFRDTTWAVHVPRRLQEARVELAKAQEELHNRLGRLPTVRELSELMSLSEEEVIEARKAANAYTAGSIDVPVAADRNTGREATLADVMGDEEPALELFENLHALAPLVAELDERERRLLHLRFVEEKTQSEIGKELGVSQMHVSRLLTRVVGRLREGLTAD